MRSTKKLKFWGIAVAIGLLAGCHQEPQTGNRDELAEHSRQSWLDQQQKEHPDFDRNDPEFTENARIVVRGDARYLVETKPNPEPMALGRVGIDEQASVLDKMPLPSTSGSPSASDSTGIYSRVVNPMADPNKATELRNQTEGNRIPVNKYGNPIKQTQQGQNAGKGTY